MKSIGLTIILTCICCLVLVSCATPSEPNEISPSNPLIIDNSPEADDDTENSPPEENELIPDSPTSEPSSTLYVHFIDVGQGDSTLIDLDDQEILIDGGDRSPGVVSYISQYVDDPLEAVIATHPHADHIGGLISVLNSFEVEEIWHNGDTATSKTYSDFMDCVESEGAGVHIGKRGDIISIGDLRFTVLHPINCNDSTNNNSLVLSLSYGDIDFLFTGDAEVEAEASMLSSSSVSVPDIDILKIGHHGSSTASSQDFLDATSPEIAVYMAGEGNTYGHPHEETIVKLCGINAEIYGTDVHGTITVSTDGNTYDITIEKEANPVSCGSSTGIPDEEEEEDDQEPSDSEVKITKIYYDGQVYRVESDEYVEITNKGTESQDLEGWMLMNVSDGHPSFTFPHYLLEPDESIRVYTDEIHPEYGGFSFGYGKAAWNNSSPDTAALYNDEGEEVSRRSY